MNKAIQMSGAAGAASATGIGLMSVALGAVVVGAIAAVTAIVAVTAGLFKLGQVGVETASSVESAFAGVLKTTQGLGTNLFDLTDAGEVVFQQFRDMAKEIPLTFEELADIGQLVGQLGVAEDQIVGVTEVIAALGVSTNLSIQDAALIVSRFATVMSETGDVTTEQFERISSALVFLGNNFKARESEIVLTARNIAGAASLVGMGEADVLALGTAVIEAGVTAEAGGSAIQNTITTIQKAVSGGSDALELFAENAGLSAEEFSTLWRVDATEAFTLFIEGLTEQGADAITTLDELDLAQRRSIRTLLGISKSSIDLRGIIEDSNQAFEDNTALSREAQIRYETFDSQVQILKNRIRDLGITIGLELLPRLLELVDKIGPVINAIGEKLEPVIESIADTIQESVLPALGDLATAIGIDVSPEGIASAIETIGTKVSDNLEDFSGFITKVAELIDLTKDKGLAGFLEGLGVPAENSQSFADAAVAIGAFVLAAKGISAATTAIGGLAAVFVGSTLIADLGAFIALAGEAGLAGALVALTATPIGAITALAAAIVALGVAIATIDEEDIAVFKGLGDQLGEIGGLLPGAIEGVIKSEIEKEKGGFLEWLDAVKNFFTVTLPASTKELSAGISLWAKNVVTDMSTFFGETLPQFVEEVIPNIITMAADLAEEIRLKMIDAWNWVWPRIKNAFREAGKSIINGFVKGMQGRMPWALSQIRAFGEQLAAASRESFGIGSPSKVFAEIGENVMRGLAKGIEDVSMKPQMAVAASMNRVVGEGMKSVPSSSVSTSSVDRSFHTGDMIFNAQPESPNSVTLTLQRLALMQQG